MNTNIQNDGEISQVKLLSVAVRSTEVMQSGKLLFTASRRALYFKRKHSLRR
jgi:hypothetical protein